MHAAPKQAARPVTSDEDLYTAWYRKENLADHLLEECWLPMTAVLDALGEKSNNNARRYLCEDSDSPRKRWTLGPRSNLGVEGRDWKVVNGSKKGGGGKKRGTYVVKDAFLKRVALARYRHRLSPRG